MADLIINQALGRSLPLIQNVKDNSPAAAEILLLAWVITATDATLRDVADVFVDTFEGTALVDEATPYTRHSIVAGDITITVDDSNDQTDVIFADQTFTAVAVQTGWSDITLVYDTTGSDADSALQTMLLWDFVVVPNGGDITVDFPDASAAYRIKQA